MSPIHSHYSNLKVARDAPTEVIKAAYRALSQKHHPDIAKTADSHRIMSIINASYAVLMDTERRKQHDLWITEQERQAQASSSARARAEEDEEASERAASQAAARAAAQAAAQAVARERAEKVAARRAAEEQQRYLFWPLIGKLVRSVSPRIWLLFLGIAVFIILTQRPRLFSLHYDGPEAHQAVESYRSPAPQHTPLLANASATAPEKQDLAPNGLLWPANSDYLADTPVGRANGHSTITIDNSGTNADFVVKLVHMDIVPPRVVRQLYLPRGTQFTMRDVTAGNYEIRYRHRELNKTFHFDPFALTEEQDDDGIHFSNVSYTLFAVRGENVHPQEIPNDEF